MFISGGVPGRGSGVMSELRDYRTFSCSIQLSMKFKLLINIEIFKINKIFRLKTTKPVIYSATIVLKCQQLLAF